MKAKVLKRFKDKHSGKIHEQGEVLTISKDRFNEILKVGAFVEEIPQKKTEKAAE